MAASPAEAPVVELVLIGVAVLLSIAAIAAQGVTFGGALGLMSLLQLLYPVAGALPTAAVVSLLLRRLLRRHRAELSAELGSLQEELATLRASATDG